MSEVADFLVQLASPPDRERLVVAIMVDGEQWCELNHESTELVAEFYARQSAAPWILPFADAIAALAEGRELLVSALDVPTES